MTSYRNLVSTFRNQASNGSFTHDEVTKIASLAAQQAEQNIMIKQAAAQQQANRVYTMREKVASAIDHVTNVRLLVKMAEEGMLPPEELEALPELLDEADGIEEGLSEALLENEDLAEAQAEAIIEAASEDPSIAAEIIQELDGLDVSPEDVDGASDVVAEALLADPAEGEKAAALIKQAANILEVTTPVANLLLQKIAHKKVTRYLAQ